MSRVAPGAPGWPSSWSRCELSACGRSSTPRNVLVITLDTLRADRLGSYGYKDCGNAGARRVGRPWRPLRGGDHDDAADPVGPHQPLHRHLADGPRRARQHRLLRRRSRADAGRDAESARLSHRRLRRRLRPRPSLGHRPGLRHLLRRVRPVRGRRTGTRRHPAASRRGRRPGARLARPVGRTAVLRLGPPLRSPHAIRSAVGLRAPLPEHARRRLRRRDRLHRLAGRAAPERPRVLGTSRRHAGGRPGRSRRAARRAQRAVARLLRLRRGGADSADHRRARRVGRGSCPTRYGSST